MKEKLIITLEVEDLPEGFHFVDFQITIMEKGWLSRIFKDWRKVTFKRAMVKDMKVEKFGV